MEPPGKHNGLPNSLLTIYLQNSQIHFFHVGYIQVCSKNSSQFIFNIIHTQINLRTSYLLWKVLH